MSDESPKRARPPIGLIALALIVVVGGCFAIRMFLYNSTHVTTDDAYVTTDVVPVNAQVPGNIVSVQVSENQYVTAGTLLAQLDDASYRADVDQAAANLAVAQANARSASAELTLTAATGKAQVAQAQGSVQAGGSDIATAQANVQRARSGVQSANSTYRSSLAQARAADEAVQTQVMDRARIAKQITGARAAVGYAEAGVKVAQANLSNAQATASNARHDAARYRDLANQGAVSVSQAESRETAAANAEAAVEAARQQVAAAQAAVQQRRSDLAAAQEQISLANAAIGAALAQASAAHENARAQAAKINDAKAGLTAAEEGVEGAQARKSQAEGKLQEADVLPKRLSISEAARQQALAKVRQAQASLASARLSLARTRITASTAGRISRKTAQLGQQVTPGQPLMTIVPSERPWIVANFKETQLADVRPGQRVEIDIDAIPGHSFRGHVDSIAAGTGSTFALLPADNATGNFTKVVQRVSVKITLDPGQKDLERLAAGLSASVAIVVK